MRIPKTYMAGEDTTHMCGDCKDMDKVSLLKEATLPTCVGIATTDKFRILLKT